MPKSSNEKKKTYESRFYPISVRVRQFAVNFLVKFAITPRQLTLSSDLNLFIDENTSCCNSILRPWVPTRHFPCDLVVLSIIMYVQAVIHSIVSYRARYLVDPWSAKQRMSNSHANPIELAIVFIDLGNEIENEA